MKKRIRFSKPSPALAIACIALFVAMGGVSYGVATGSIDSREIKDGSIRNRDFKDGTLRGNEAKRNGFGGGAIKESSLTEKIPASSTRWVLVDEDGSIRNRDFKDGTLRGNEAKRNGFGGGAIKESTLTEKIPASSTRWVLVDEDGNIVEQSGGFQVVSKPGTNGQPVTNPNVYIGAGSSLVSKGLGATTALRNQGGGGFNGDTSVGRCNTPRVTCVPTNTNNDNTLVVRSLVDNSDVTSAARGFYVEVSE